MVNGNEPDTPHVCFKLHFILPLCPQSQLTPYWSTEDTFLRVFQLSNIVLHPYQSVQCVWGGGGACVRVCLRACLCVRAYVCVCVCARARILHILCLNSCRCLHYVLVFLQLLITFSISMYIMCVTSLCLFSAFSHGVGALQMSMNTIISVDRCEAVRSAASAVQPFTADFGWRVTESETWNAYWLMTVSIFTWDLECVLANDA